MSKIVNGYEIKPKANLKGANLDGADIQGADLRGITLGDAYIWNANVDGAILATGWKITRTP